MKNHRSLWMRFILLLVVSLFILSTVSGGLVQAKSEAPDFTVKTTDGEFTLSEQRKPVIIDFMTPLCSECKQLEGNLKEVYADYENDVKFISIDISGSSISRLEDLKEERNVPWEIGQGSEELFIGKYQGTAVPMLVIVDEGGNITYKHTGSVGTETLKDNIDQTLSGEAETIGLGADYGIFTLAAVAGIASFFSPCAFPLLPSYIAYYITPKGDKTEKVEDGLMLGGKAALGIVLVFGVLGMIGVMGGRWFVQNITYLEPVVGSIIIILGIALLLDVNISGRLSGLKRKIRNLFNLKGKKSTGHSSPFFYGLGYGTAAAGCMAPVFIAVIMASWLSGGMLSALLVLFIFLSTFAFLMILFSVLTIFFRKRIMKNITRWMNAINKISAFILIGAGAYILYYFFTSL